LKNRKGRSYLQAIQLAKGCEVGCPGGIFNPLNFAPTFEAKEKEIANGRFAMFGILGYL